MIKDLKTYKNGDFDVEIIDVEKVGDVLRVKTRCPFGEDNFGISASQEYLDTDGVPKWKKNVRRLLLKKYGTITPDGSTTTAPKKVYKEHLGKFKLGEIANKK